jgi:hypothetical protein
MTSGVIFGQFSSPGDKASTRGQGDPKLNVVNTVPVESENVGANWSALTLLVLYLKDLKSASVSSAPH